MPNNVINKVVYGDRTLIDLTDTTADAADVASGKYFYAKDGVKTLGTGSIGGENGDVYQDAEGYIVLKPGAGTNVSVTPLSVTENGTYSAPTGVAYSPVEVNVGPARSLSDITVSGSIVSGPAGLYSEAFSKAVSAGSGILTAGGGGLSTSLTINSSTGLITKTSSSATFTVKMQSGTFVSGYFSSYTDVRAAAVTFTTSSSTIQLPTLAATTYTPTETSQIIDRYQWLTGSQTIAAISSTYVGTGIDRRSAADIYQSGNSVYTPSGYYSSTEVFQIPTTDHLDPTLAFTSATGYIQATHDAEDAIINNKIMRGAYGTRSSMMLPVFAATTWTPSSTNQYISSYQWLTGSQTILGDNNLIASNIKSGVSIFGVTGTVPDENDMPTVYQTWDDDLGGYTYSCNYTYNQILTMLTNLNGDPLAGELHDMNYDTYHGNWITYRYGGTWSIDDSYPLETYICLKTLYYKYIYHSNSLIESVNMDQDKEVIPSQNTQYINPDYPHEYLNYVKILGDANLVSSNIRSGVSIFGVNGTMEEGITDPYYPVYKDLAENKVITSSAIANDYFNSLSIINFGQFGFAQLSGYFTFNNATEIKQYAFASNYGDGKYVTPVATFSFPSVISIEAGAFLSATSIAALYFPKCTTVSSDAFKECAASIYELPLCETIRAHAFQSCWIQSIVLSKCSSIASTAFYYCGSLSTASFSICTYIGSSAFNGCNKLEVIYAPNCTTIESQAFMHCSSLQSAIFPSCTSMGASAFCYCTGLTTISFNVCTSISASTFYNCSKLYSVFLPSCETVGIAAFYNCYSTSFTSINLPNCTVISANAFSNCYNLSSLSFSKVTYLGNSAFCKCSNISIVRLSNCSSIGSYTFQSCWSLSTIYISSPESGTIGAGAFNTCSNLKSVYLTSPYIYSLGSTTAFFNTPISVGQSGLTTTFAFNTITNPLLSQSTVWVTAAAIGASFRGYSGSFKATWNLSSTNYEITNAALLLAFCINGVWSESNWTGGATYSVNGHWWNVLTAYTGTKTFNVSTIPANASQVRIGIYNNATMQSTTATLSGSATLSTPSIYGSIYVPASLYASYKAATNWVTYSSRFVSLTDAEIAALPF